MNVNKAKKFNSKMGRAKFVKGGSVRHMAARKYFDAGGVAQNTIAPTTGTANSTTSSQSLNNTGLANAIGAGNSFQAGSANIQSGTNADQLANQYTGAQNAINAQVGLTNTLTPQAGTAVGNQNALAAQELAMTQGQGPNPALAQLAQTTNQNVNNQAALMAGQRGASANVGELARQAAQQGATTQEQAVGQAATTEANQQIAAQQNLANLSANQVNQTGQAVGNLNTQQQNEQNILQGANSAYNNNAVGMQSNINNVNAQTAAGNQAANQGIIKSVASAIPGVGSILGGLAKGGEVGRDEHLMLAEMNAHSMNHAKKFADGGPVQSNLGTSAFNPVQGASGDMNVAGTPNFGTNAQTQANQDFQQAFSGLGKKTVDAYNDAQFNKAEQEGEDEIDQEYAPVSVKSGNMVAEYTGGSICQGPHKSHVANYLAAGGKVPAMVSPGERYLNPDEVKAVEKGANPEKMGRVFQGKAKVAGDSLKNDVIPADLDSGGVVIDRKTMNKKSPKAEARFVKRAVHMKSPKAGNQ